KLAQASSISLARGGGSRPSARRYAADSGRAVVYALSRRRDAMAVAHRMADWPGAAGALALGDGIPRSDAQPRPLPRRMRGRVHLPTVGWALPTRLANHRMGVAHHAFVPA